VEDMNDLPVMLGLFIFVSFLIFVSRITSNKERTKDRLKRAEDALSMFEPLNQAYQESNKISHLQRLLAVALLGFVSLLVLFLL
jgi:hypothetical protein